MRKELKATLAACAITTGLFMCSVSTDAQEKQPDILLGDVNGNGSLELEDASGMLKMALKLRPQEEENYFIMTWMEMEW